MENNNIDTLINSIKSDFDALEKKINEHIINDKEAHELLDELDSVVKKHLTTYFGEERCADENDDCLKNLGFSKGFMKYDGSNYKHGVVFNYWSHKGELIESSLKRKGNIFRDNLFAKGYRWSRTLKKKLFYDFFNEIKKAVDGDAPVDFFVEYGIDLEIQHLKIVSVHNISASKGIIILPNLKSANNVKSTKFKELIKNIYKLNALPPN